MSRTPSLSRPAQHRKITNAEMDSAIVAKNVFLRENKTEKREIKVRSGWTVYPPTLSGISHEFTFRREATNSRALEVLRENACDQDLSTWSPGAKLLTR